MATESSLHDPLTAPPSLLREQLRVLAFGCAYGSAERAYQLRTLRHRLSIASLLIGVAILAWIPFDLAALTPAPARTTLVWRGTLAALLLLLAYASRQGARTTLAAYPMLLVFIGAQCVLFALMQAHVAADAPPLLRLGYGLLPFIVGAQLALFPLPLLATALLSLPILGWVLLPAPLPAPFAPELALAGTLWLLGLILIVAAWAGAAQLALLQGLLHARNDAAHDALTGLANRRMARSRCSRSTSTTSSASTTRTATPAAIRCWSNSRACCAASCAPMTSRHGSAARNSPRSCPAPMPPLFASRKHGVHSR